MTNTEQIENRIKELTLERTTLESVHNAMVQQNQKQNQEFQQQVAQNQTRFAQITGALAELQKLLANQTEGDTNNDNIPTSTYSGYRPLNVCAGVESQDR